MESQRFKYSGKSVQRCNITKRARSFSTFHIPLQNMIQAHLHAGSESDEVPVVVILVPVTENPSGGSLPSLNPPQSGDLSFNGVFNAGDFVGPLKGQSMENFQQQAKNNQIYVNVHTVENPAGLVRGQLKAA